MRYDVVFEGYVREMRDGDPHGRTPEPDELSEIIDSVMDALIALNPDATIGASGETGSVEIEVTVDALDPEAALSLGSSQIRAAIHEAGGFTRGWTVEWCDVKSSEVREDSSDKAQDDAGELIGSP